MTIHSTAGEALTLQSHIDAAMMARIDKALQQAFIDLVRARDAQWSGVRNKIIRLLQYLFVGVALVGMIGSLVSPAKLGLTMFEDTTDPVYALFFLVALIVGILFFKKLDKWGNLLRPRFHRLLAPVFANKFIGAARKCVPFDARYIIEGDQASYARVQGDVVQPLWSKRKMQGVRVTGDGFTLLFKTPRAPTPYLMFLHTSSADFDALLDRIGVPPLTFGPAAAAPPVR